MKILVTGGTGFLGQKLALRLLQIGYEVTITGRNEMIGLGLTQKGLRFIQADLRNSNQMRNTIKGMDYVFHCGSLSTPWGNYRNFFETNVIGTENVITGCRLQGVRRLIHVSSPSIYFEYRDKLNITENDPLPPKMVNHYAKTKFLAEQRINAAFVAGLPVITLRPRAIFGPGDTTIFPRLILANQKLGIPLIDGGLTLMDLTYIENVIEALILSIDSAPETLGKKYNISNGTPVPLKDLLDKLFFKLGLTLRTRPVSFSSAYFTALFLETFFKTFLPNSEPPFTRYTVGLLSKSLTLNISAARKELGFEPKISTDVGLGLFADSWKEKQV